MPTRRDGSEPIIAHGSVYLRAAEREDIPLFVRWFNDWRTTRTLGMRAPLSIPLEEQWFEDMLASQGKDGYLFVACLLEDDRPLGTIGLFALDLVNGNAGLGISVGDEADRGQGHGSDMLRALLRFAFASLRLERVWLDVYDINESARHVYERAGFVHEGTLRSHAFREGRYLDVVRMGILADEWRATLEPGDQGAARPR
jgi:diamine N-acetyltransferase